MNSEKNNVDQFDEFAEKFDTLVSQDKISIDAIENLMLENIEVYKQKLNHHVEELLKKNIDEMNLVAKKNKSGKKRDTD